MNEFYAYIFFMLGLVAMALWAQTAEAGERVPNQEVSLTAGSIAVVAHAHPSHLPTYRAQVGANVTDASDGPHYAAVKASCTASTAEDAWGSWYGSLSTPDQVDVCDLIDGSATGYQVHLRYHLEETLTDETTLAIGPTDFTGLVADAKASQSLFDTAAAGHWPALWTGLTNEEKATYRTLVLGVGW